jgi:hypothetical protein
VTALDASRVRNGMCVLSHRQLDSLVEELLTLDQAVQVANTGPHIRQIV